MMNAERAAEIIGGAVRSGRTWKVKCPCHNDSTPSLCIDDGESGRPVFHCPVCRCTWDDLKPHLEKWGVLVRRKKNADALNGHAAPDSAKPRRKFVCAYDYVDENGALLYQKIRFEPKDFRLRRPDGNGGWTYKLGNMRRVLYRLPALLQGIASERVVLLCEGEKDCETVAQGIATLGGLAYAKYVATCCADGAPHWRSEYSDVLKRAAVIVLEHNDEAGRKWVENVRLSLSGKATRLSVVRFDGEREHYDAADFVAEKGAAALMERIEDAEELKLEAADLGSWKRGDKEHAAYEDYIGFMRSVPKCQALERELLTDDVYWKRDGEWKPVENEIGYFKSHASDHGEFFSRSDRAWFEHIQRHKLDALKPRLLIDIPAWDGVDRIAEQARIFRFENVTDEEFWALALQFGATMFQRLEDPGIQPITPVLCGPQGCGKDSLIKAWGEALDRYFMDLKIGDRDTVELERQLHLGVLFSISEFGRSQKRDIETLKDILTKSTAYARLPYERRGDKRLVRASFIASMNPGEPLPDTENRRYWMFDCEYLGYYPRPVDGIALDDVPPGQRVKDAYPGLWCRPAAKAERLQILAQFRAAANEDFKAPAAVIAKMDAYVAGESAPDMRQLMCEDFDRMVAELTAAPDARTLQGVSLYSASTLSGILDKLCASYKWSRRIVLQHLGSNGRRHKRNGCMLYCSGAAGNAAVGDEDLEF